MKNTSYYALSRTLLSRPGMGQPVGMGQPPWPEACWPDVFSFTVLGISVSGSSLLGFNVLGFNVLGFNVLGFKVLGFKVLGYGVRRDQSHSKPSGHTIRPYHQELLW